MAQILTEKVKVQVRVCHTFTFCCNLAEEIKVWRALTWTFTFLVRICAIFGELSHFSLLGGTSSILRTFLGGTSQNKHPVYCRVKKTKLIEMVEYSRSFCEYLSWDSLVMQAREEATMARRRIKRRMTPSMKSLFVHYLGCHRSFQNIWNDLILQKYLLLTNCQSSFTLTRYWLKDITHAVSISLCRSFFGKEVFILLLLSSEFLFFLVWYMKGRYNAGNSQHVLHLRIGSLFLVVLLCVILCPMW